VEGDSSAYTAWQALAVLAGAMVGGSAMTAATAPAAPVLAAQPPALNQLQPCG